MAAPHWGQKATPSLTLVPHRPQNGILFLLSGNFAYSGKRNLPYELSKFPIDLPETP
jgi:hypothetical protein